MFYQHLEGPVQDPDYGVEENGVNGEAPGEEPEYEEIEETDQNQEQEEEE